MGRKKILILGNPYSLGDSRSHIREVCGEDVVKRCSPIWGLNEEGEINGAWRSLGVKGLWYMIGMWSSLCIDYIDSEAIMSIGNLAFCRFHSKHVALRKYSCIHLLCFYH